jgi:hypothetical protein
MSDWKLFQVGDLVTRDGTDVQRILSLGYDTLTVECVRAPDDGWCEVGDTEFNMSRRYSFAGEEVAGQTRAPCGGLLSG